MTIRRLVFLSVFAMLLGLLAPVVVPRLITDAWGRGGLALYLFLQSWFGLLGLADLGIQSFVTREAVSCMSRSESALAKAYIVQGRRFLLSSVALGALVAIVYALLTQKVPSSFESMTISPHFLRGAIVVQILASGWITYAGGISTIIELVGSKDSGPTLYGMTHASVQVMAVALFSVRNTQAMASFLLLSAVACIVASIRYFRAKRLFSNLFQDDVSLQVPKNFLGGLMSSVVLVLGQGLQVSFVPLLVSGRAPLVATIAIPCRTMGNMATKFPSIVSNILWPRLTRQVSLMQNEQRQRYSLGILLAGMGLHLAAASFLILFGVDVFRWWLPSLSAEAEKVFPFLAVEQCFGAIAAPLALILYVNGRLVPIAIGHMLSGIGLVCLLLFCFDLNPTTLSLSSALAIGFLQIPVWGYAVIQEFLRTKKKIVLTASLMAIVPGLLWGMGWSGRFVSGYLGTSFALILMFSGWKMLFHSTPQAA